jgi:[ribosomal protein S5]-alanine N-acetyltransferase
MIIQLDRCTLRRWQAGDEASLAEHANNYKIWLNVRDYFPHPYTPADARNWIAYASNQRPLTNFAIVIDSLAVGGIGVVLKEDIYRRSAEIGYWLGEPYWNRGIMSDMPSAILISAGSTLAFLTIMKLRRKYWPRRAIRTKPG